MKENKNTIAFIKTLRDLIERLTLSYFAKGTKAVTAASNSFHKEGISRTC
jgi:hypothetical protein